MGIYIFSKEKLKNHPKATVALIIAVSFFAGCYCRTIYYNLKQDRNSPEIRTGGYKFINPLLECRDSQIDVSQELRIFKGEISDFVDSEIGSKKINFASFYFRDLANGPWFGINEKEEFTAASLLKVPVMIAAYKYAENDQGLLNRVITISEEPSYDDQYIKPEKKLIKGQKLKFSELIDHMIRYSDNYALTMITKTIGVSSIIKEFNDLGLTQPSEYADYQINVKNYASFFRILYNSSYLDQHDSEKALELLSNTSFNQGLTGEIPSEVIVSHKFGERYLNDSSLHQLHDCGIVYYPQKPYLICIMTRGADMGAMEDFISKLSRLTYDNVDRQQRKNQN
jgi:beta-lactamase class A